MLDRPRVPITIALGLALSSLVVVARVSFRFLDIDKQIQHPWFWLATGGLGFVAQCMFASGARDLSRRLTGGAATGAQLIVAAFVVSAAWSTVAPLLGYLWRESPSEGFRNFQSYLYMAFGLVASAGMISAARSRDGVAMAASVLIVLAAIVCWPPPPLVEIIPALQSASHVTMVIQYSAYLLFYGCAFILIRAAAHAAQPAVDQPREAVGGLLSIAGALLLRLAAAGIALVLTLMAAVGKSPGMIKFITVATPAFNALSLLLFGLACLRVSRADHAERPPFLVAGCLSLWLFAVSATQTVYLYAMMSGDSGSSFYRDSATSLAIPQAIVGILAIVVALAAAAARARRFALVDHAQRAVVATYSFLALTLAALGITHWMIPKVQSVSGYLFAVIVMGGLGVIAVIAAIKAFNSIAADTEGTPLPVATVVPPSPTPS